MAMRAGHPQLRSLHFLLYPFPEPEGRPFMSVLDIRVIGLGNPLRGDDGVGPGIIAHLQQRLWPDSVSLMVYHGDGASLMDIWAGASHVVLCDAIRSDDPPGTVRILNVNRTELPLGLFPCSSHAFGIAEAVELARVLGRLPPWCRIVGITAGEMSPGAPLSPAVADAVPRAAEGVAAELCALLEQLQPNP